jgi:hypothetical protein
VRRLGSNLPHPEDLFGRDLLLRVPSRSSP